ncbi:uncharacterized protein LOC124912778, partial [Impatiens glandulifera]|uniref:uncharacterized protein LOC124912778 n=1 Tax=Impatiens glandulifera TaxID=253017 RepID=UPI001FB0DF2A
FAPFGIWNRRLQIYPRGNIKEGGEGHISLYIEVVENHPIVGPLNVIIKLFVKDQMEEKYYTIPDYKAVHLSGLKRIWGIPKFMDLEVFNDSSNGYLVNDACLFGAEIFIITPLSKVDVLSLRDDGKWLTRTHFWKVKSFSEINFVESDTFTCGDFRWKIRLFPKGASEDIKWKYISVYLCLDVSSIPSDTKVSTTYTLRVTNEEKSTIFEEKSNYHYFSELRQFDGVLKFMSLAKILDPSRGVLVNDTLFIEAEVSILGVDGLRKLRAERSDISDVDLAEEVFGTQEKGKIIGMESVLAYRVRGPTM